ncbi:nucleotidyltransferase domain-containing protein [Spirochaeta thermophila]|uniref:nucleotidyltransferase domain-containing protein n=1 Tax=Winmispira thermophila TaxID=154 RepID=UPI001F22AA63|nr:nucleotidyltransferase domain-containing protein [Spirochaeta thermophila]
MRKGVHGKGRRSFPFDSGGAIPEDEVKPLIGKLIREHLGENGLHPERILLFGSRARGDSSKGSDWDILVIVRERLSIQEKRRISRELRRVFAGKLIPVDILVKTAEELPSYESLPGSITREALHRGVPL